MQISQLTLEQFRNAENQSLFFSDGVNLLYGANAQGKTNAVEAIYYLAGLKSFRCPKYREMIAYDAKQARITGRIALQKQEVSLTAVLPRTGHRTVQINGWKPEKLSEYLGVFRAVLFCPEHLRLVKDGPGERRAFLDGAICQLKPTYVSLLNEFNRISAHRAALFRAARERPSLLNHLEVWDESYAAVSVRISRIRREYLLSLAPVASEYYHALSSGKEELSFSYQCDVDPSAKDAAEAFRELLVSHRETERRNLFAPKGAHRDDVVIRINGRVCRFYASQGQQRSAVLAMKLAEGEMSRLSTGETPVFLLDDVLSELDGERREFILSHVGSGQVIVTSCDPDGFPFVEGLHKIRVSEGRYSNCP